MSNDLDNWTKSKKGADDFGFTGIGDEKPLTRKEKIHIVISLTIIIITTLIIIWSIKNYR